MKILYEAGHLLGTKTGIGYYTQGLIEHLAKIDQKNRYELFGFYFITKRFDSPIKKLPPNARWRLTRLIPGKIHNLLSRLGVNLPVEFVTGAKPDVAIFTNYVRQPSLTGAPTITFVYDLSFARFEQFAYRKIFNFYKQQLPGSIKKSTRIITISNSIKRELLEDYKIDPDKIEVIYPGVDLQKFYKRSPGQIAKVRKKYGLDKKYILFTGTVEPRKNITNIIRAYKKLPANLRAEYQLVLAGGLGYHDDELNRAFKDAEKRKLNIKKTGYVDDADFPAIYSGASLYIFPSHYEGFGMTPLEAMACDVPVITSNVSSLPEVAGQAALLIDPLEPSKISQAMRRVLEDKQLADQLVARGRQQVKKFDWNHSAQQLCDIIKQVYDQKK